MAKYKLKKSVISVYIAGKIFEDKTVIFDTESEKWKNHKEQINTAFKGGFLDEVEEESKKGKQKDDLLQFEKKGKK